MKSIKSVGTVRENIKAILDVISSLVQKVRSNKIPLALEYVRITEKFDVVRRSQGREWVVMPDREQLK